MGLIKNIEKKDELFSLGKLYVPFFDEEIDVWLENTVDMNYVEKCAEHLVNLNDDMIDEFCEKAIVYYRFMLEEWMDYSDMYGDLVEEIQNNIPEDVEGREILKFISNPHMYVFPPEEDGIGYDVECDCIWEPEHQLDLIIRDDQVLYVGPSEGIGPWADEDEYEFPWEN